MSADLTLVYEALVASVQELDRIFERDDVALAGLINVVDHRGEGRRLSAAGRSGQENQTFRNLAELLDDFRQAKLLDGQNLRRDLPKRGADSVVIPIHVHAKPRHFGNHIGEVRVARIHELVAMPFGEDGLYELENLLSPEHGSIRHLLHVAVDAPAEPVMRAQMQVRCLFCDHLFQQLVELRRARLVLFGLGETLGNCVKSGVRLHHVVEEGQISTNGIELHARDVLSDGAHDARRGVIDHSKRQNVAVDLERQDTMSLAEFFGQEPENLRFGRALAHVVLGKRDLNRDFVQPVCEPLGKTEAELRDLLEHRVETLGAEFEGGEVGKRHDRGGALFSEKKAHFSEGRALRDAAKLDGVARWTLQANGCLGAQLR